MPNVSRLNQVPYYAADGRSLGFRSIGTALRLIAAGSVKPSYGRKRQLKAIWLQQEDGSNPIETQPRPGTPYVFREHLPTGQRCWRHKRVDRKDESGEQACGRDDFFRVLRDRMR